MKLIPKLYNDLLCRLSGGSIQKRRLMPKHPKSKEDDPKAYDDYILYILELQRRKELNLIETKKVIKAKVESNKKAAEELNRKKAVVMSALENEVSSIPFTSEGYAEAVDDLRQKKIDKWNETKNMINSTLTGIELMTAGYGVARGLGHLGKWATGKYRIHGLTPSQNLDIHLRFDNLALKMDVPLVIMNGTGTTVDLGLLAFSDNTFNDYENSIEAGLGTLGLIGGTNILRRMPFLKRFHISGDHLDNIFDSAGYTAASYDIIKHLPPLKGVIRNLEELTQHE